MALDGSGYLSLLVQLDVAHFMNYATGFLAEFHNFLGFLKSSRNRYRAWSHFLIFHLFLDFLHLLFIFQDYILNNSCDSEVYFECRLFLNKWLSIPLQFPCAGQFWVICWVTLTLSLLSLHSLHQFPGAGRRTLKSVLLLVLLLLLLLRLPSTFKYNQSSVRNEALRVSQK